MSTCCALAVYVKLLCVIDQGSEIDVDAFLLPSHSTLRYLHSDLELDKEYAQNLKKQEAQRLVAQKKLSLVFDLDHTLLNSSRLLDITGDDMPLLDAILEKEEADAKEDKDGGGKPKSLFFLDFMQMWTKVRPGCRNLLAQASKYFDMHVYTMGERKYALEMAKLIDPDGSLFGDHIVSKVGDQFCIPAASGVNESDLFVVLIAIVCAPV